MRFRVGARTDVGRVREGNEDAFMAHDPLFAVADGMGGHQGGEVASKLALDTLKGVAERRDANLAEVVREANRVVFRKASEDPGLAGMGTTLTAVVDGGDGLLLAHVGDSRAYLLRDGALDQLTKDHTVVQRLVDEGRLTPSEAEMHPQRSILTRAIGVDEEIEVDETTLDVRAGDRLLLCSDGLTGMVSEDDILRILGADADPQAACEALVDAANEAGGQDNVTAVVIDVLEDDEGETAAPAEATEPAPGAAETAAPGPGNVEGPREAVAARPAPPRVRGSWLPRAVLWLVVAVLVIGGGLFAAKELYVDRQWFVGQAGGNVALYRGIPAEPLGIDLASLVEEFPAIPAAEVTTFPEYRELNEGITAESEDDARGIIGQMQQDLQARQAEEMAGP